MSDQEEDEGSHQSNEPDSGKEARNYPQREPKGWTKEMLKWSDKDRKYYHDDLNRDPNELEKQELLRALNIKFKAKLRHWEFVQKQWKYLEEGPDPKLWTTLREAWFLEMLHHKSTLEEQITGMYRKFGKRVSEDELGRKRQQLKMEGRYRYDDRQEEWYVDEVNDMERWKREYEAKKGKKSS